MTKDSLPSWAVKALIWTIALIVVTGASFVISDRISVGNDISALDSRTTRLEANDTNATRERSEIKGALEKIDAKLDKIIDRQIGGN